jgi:hypothetical protein
MLYQTEENIIAASNNISQLKERERIGAKGKKARHFSFGLPTTGEPKH